jgi:putative restriction endonuclease
MVSIWVANTDLDWFDFLAQQPRIDEVNFWQPSGTNNFAAIQPGELFVFKLKSPRNAIGGYGVLSQSSNIPLSLAWEAFGTKNGARSLSEMRERVGQYRGSQIRSLDYTIGCRVVVEPIFFPPEFWIPQPSSWSRAIVVGKTYSTADAEGRLLWERLVEAGELSRRPLATDRGGLAEDTAPLAAFDKRFGEPQLIQPRLGQGAFRLAVTDAYNRRCAISGGKVLPALDAAHIRAFAAGGAHEVRNGLLLRRDIHSLFDAGYVTFDENLRMVVSDRVRTEFNNGEEYRRLHGSTLLIPKNQQAQPDKAALEWHRSEVFAR